MNTRAPDGANRPGVRTGNMNIVLISSSLAHHGQPLKECERSWNHNLNSPFGDHHSHVYVMVLVLTMGLIICVENLTSASKYYKSSDWKQPEASEKAWPGRLLCHSSAATPDIGIYYLCQKLFAMKCAMLWQAGRQEPIFLCDFVLFHS